MSDREIDQKCRTRATRRQSAFDLIVVKYSARFFAAFAADTRFGGDRRRRQALVKAYRTSNCAVIETSKRGCTGSHQHRKNDWCRRQARADSTQAMSKMRKLLTTATT